MFSFPSSPPFSVSPQRHVFWSMESPTPKAPPPFICALAIFRSILNEELIRSFTVYGLEDKTEYGFEREFLFSPLSYLEMKAQPVLKLNRSEIRRLKEGEVRGLWLCMLAFDISNESCSSPIPTLLAISSNPKLKSVPTLVGDIQMVSDWRVNQNFSGDSNDEHRRRVLLDLDLNCIPYTDETPMSFENQQDDQYVPEGVDRRRRKRAASEQIAKISMDDLVKHFDLPIAEASKNLNVGLTVLKKKCREFGIPRWPHRKIKSLDSLIHNLQEEAERQERENKAAAMAVTKRQRMLESEKETIERKPFMEIQSETKRFRQDVFKRRHKARVRSRKNQ